MAKEIKCPICQGYHIIDKYNCVQTCIGYHPLSELDNVFHNYFTGQNTGRITTKGNTKGNTKNAR